ncbi:hypothetical protein LAUMK35_04054 [Mycobacterium pseudokansasii]|nr:hypothetical protein A4G27_05455 [Mycobacterium kansasii]VAZ98599.1 hypothetical protein LAUMK35_04054 [Mycobacterium pseudokansasii]VBA29741.1 hypothetical protein LAUMK21_04050 [Mycobacterium pseudokansasii]
MVGGLTGSIDTMPKSVLFILFTVGGLLQAGVVITGTLAFRDHRDGSAELRNLKWAMLALAVGTVLTTIASVYALP